MKDKHTLVVVDMQPTGFTAAGEPNVINGCRKAVEKAVKNNNPVIFLEFYGGDRWPTASQLTDVTDGYNRAYFLSKDEQDGSPQVADLMNRKRLPKKKIKVCGVNTTACVLSTVQGLRQRMKDSSLVLLEDAVGGHWNDTWRNNYETIKGCTITKV